MKGEKMENIEEIKKERKRWEEECLFKKPFPKAQTEAGIELKPVYTPEDIEILWALPKAKNLIPLRVRRGNLRKVRGEALAWPCGSKAPQLREKQTQGEEFHTTLCGRL
jgi:hypothetical protein